TIRDLEMMKSSKLLNKAKKLGYSTATVERWMVLFGEDFTKKLIESYEKGIPRAIRVNTLSTSNEKLKQQLSIKGFELEDCSLVPNGFWVHKTLFPLGATTEYLLGYYTIQGIASQLPALALDPQPDEKVLDMAAAPGMKATQIAAMMKNEGTLVCLDWNQRRIRALQFNMGRLKVRNQIIIRMDSKKVDQLGIKFDKILLDAPCTGSGIIFKDRSWKKSHSIQDIEHMANVQKKLLAAGLQVLKKGGRLVYSTCSLEFEENEEIISFFLDSGQVIVEKLKLGGKPGLTQFGSKELNKELHECQRFFPHITNTEGFFICSLLKK
ncbi:MAG: RsmB/NOP family class I SAM-dependent RNA methyltransferase, partial [Promethearchaeota archaeon]